MDIHGCGEDGMLSAVLDTENKELFLSGRHSQKRSAEELVMPGAQKVMSIMLAMLHSHC